MKRSMLQKVLKTLLFTGIIMPSSLLASEPPSPTDPGWTHEFYSKCGYATYTCQNTPCTIIGTVSVTFNGSGSGTVNVPGTKIGITLKGKAGVTESFSFSSDFVTNANSHGYVCINEKDHISQCTSHGKGVDIMNII